jgi:hypothetical protein
VTGELRDGIDHANDLDHLRWQILNEALGSMSGPP